MLSVISFEAVTLVFKDILFWQYFFVKILKKRSDSKCQIAHAVQLSFYKSQGWSLYLHIDLLDSIAEIFEILPLVW